MSSLIPSWLQDFRPDVYTKLVAQEAYTQTTGDAAAWLTALASLVSSLNTWQSLNRKAIIEPNLSGVYQYLLVRNQFGIGDPNVGDADYKKIWSCGTLFDLIPTRADNYYNDWTITVGGVPPPHSPKLDADLLLIPTSTDSEKTKLEALTTRSKDSGTTLVNMALFEPLPIVTPVGKSNMATLMFTTYGWKKVYTNLNVDSLTSPI